MTKPYLGIDAAESEGESEDLYACAHVLYIACGGHAGSPVLMEKAISFCTRLGIGIGAHPSYPDREGFGRRSLSIPLEALADSVAAQCQALNHVAKRFGASITHFKLHGALYHDANQNERIAQAVLGAALEVLGSLIIVGPQGGALRAFAERHGLPFHPEGFADRRYRPDGSLLPRTEPGALISNPEEALSQVKGLIAKGYLAIGLHSDSPNALAIGQRIRKMLEESCQAPP
ncbi:MAG: LamB/YcsF family protein [Sandaracinaceae bacterium]|nr:LamB/YcsF family protein [Sandaracinaceae bacterium]MDW8245543.1 5-oxoprolinase subunit PxpA [Sandaracinaceae bacterium]